jgi:predicted Zn-dependent protease
MAYAVDFPNLSRYRVHHFQQSRIHGTYRDIKISIQISSRLLYGTQYRASAALLMSKQSGPSIFTVTSLDLFLCLLQWDFGTVTNALETCYLVVSRSTLEHYLGSPTLRISEILREYYLHI